MINHAVFILISRGNLKPYETAKNRKEIEFIFSAVRVILRRSSFLAPFLLVPILHLVEGVLAGGQDHGHSRCQDRQHAKASSQP